MYQLPTYHVLFLYITLPLSNTRNPMNALYNNESF
jgi:hypothetical protein